MECSGTEFSLPDSKHQKAPHRLDWKVSRKPLSFALRRSMLSIAITVANMWKVNWKWNKFAEQKKVCRKLLLWASREIAKIWANMCGGSEDGNARRNRRASWTDLGEWVRRRVMDQSGLRAFGCAIGSFTTYWALTTGPLGLERKLHHLLREWWGENSEGKNYRFHLGHGAYDVPTRYAPWIWKGAVNWWRVFWSRSREDGMTGDINAGVLALALEVQ